MYSDSATRNKRQNPADQNCSISGNRLLSNVEIAAIKMDVEQQHQIDELPLGGADDEETIKAEGVGQICTSRQICMH